MDKIWMIRWGLYSLPVAAMLAGGGVMLFAQDSHPATKQVPKDLHIYLLIGDGSMSDSAGIPEDAAGVLDRCFWLNESNEWEPTGNALNRSSSTDKDAGVQELGPGYRFATKMLEQNQELSIGLVVNAYADSRIEDWLGKSQMYWGARRRMKVALQSGRLQGVLWLHGASAHDEPDAYIERLKSLISNIRADFNDTSLPFIAGQVHDHPAINAQIAKLPESVHATAIASTDALPLGERFAEQMILLQRAKSAQLPKPPSDIKFIDPHVHAMSVNAGGLDAVARWMEEMNVERCIVSPLDHKGSRPQNEEEYQAMLANFRKYKGRIDRMCLIEPQEVETVDQAVAILRKEIADGAIAFGEHYGKGMMFDDPANLRLYEACEKVGLPVMFHIDQNKNMVEPGMERVDRVLRMFPDCKLIAHAYWWRQLKHADRQLQEHPNLYADMSGAVVPNMLNRDRQFAREFLIRNQDKIMWATDEGWWSFGKKETKDGPHYTFFEELDLPPDVRYKLYRGNAEKLFGFGKKSEE